VFVRMGKLYTYFLFISVNSQDRRESKQHEDLPEHKFDKI